MKINDLPSTLAILTLFVVLSVLTVHSEKTFAAQLRVENSCWVPLNLAVRLLDANTNTWKTYSGFHFKPGRRAFLSSGGDRLETENRVIYYRAVGDGYDISWEGEAKYYEIEGESLGFRRYRDRFFNIYLPLDCGRIKDKIESECKTQCIPFGGCTTRTISIRAGDPIGKPQYATGVGFDGRCLAQVRECSAQCHSEKIENWKQLRAD